MTGLIVPSRRSFLFGLGSSLIAAPAIVRAASLMQVRVPKLSMRAITDYIPGAEVRLDVLYGFINLGDCLTIQGLPGTWVVTCSNIYAKQQ